ncbi:ABC transporter substrate-binding protein [Altererythrobacter sp.]|uniref:ABC transporter substrate-binding protein n=1 Tax=Altererythrobacter sp. TaxID=1872480 RepID=UPI003D0606A7
MSFHNRRNWAVAVSSMFAATLAACSAPSAPLRDGDGPGIVSLNPCTDAILVEVADPGQILAISHFSRDPASSSIDPATARRFKATSGTVEEVVALNPDLVLAGAFLPPATTAALTDLGFRTETFGIAGEVEQSFAQVRRIAALAGHPDRGEALIGRIERALVDSVPRPDATPIGTVLWQPGEIVPGEQTMIGTLMRHAGFSSHSAALGLGQADYLSLEQVLANPPDLLLVAGNSRGQQHPALAKLHYTRIEPLDPALLYCGGPTIARALDRLVEIRDEAE